MPFKLVFSTEAREQLAELERTNERKARRVKRALAFLEGNPKHPSLQTHEYDSFSQLLGVKVFEAYAEQRTPGAYRVFWYYGPEKDAVTIYTITPHP
jgi:hypothetical protein